MVGKEAQGCGVGLVLIGIISISTEVLFGDVNQVSTNIVIDVC